MRRRWDGDERGRGIASGESHAPHARRLLQALERPDWVTEEPHVHEWVDGDAVVFDVATGSVDDDAHFAPHGHLLRLRIQAGRAA